MSKLWSYLLHFEDIFKQSAIKYYLLHNIHFNKGFLGTDLHLKIFRKTVRPQVEKANVIAPIVHNCLEWLVWKTWFLK